MLKRPKTANDNPKPIGNSSTELSEFVQVDQIWQSAILTAEFPYYSVAAGPASPVEMASMARITVEDCLRNCKSRFELVHIGSQRTRQLMKGSRALVDNTFTQNRLVVLSLREVAAGNVKRAATNEAVLASSTR